MIANYTDLVKMRSDLDKQLELLYKNMSNEPESSTRMLESNIYANTLWIILATCLLYYIFVEL